MGIVLSQTVGQNIMQLTLDTFHNVGSGNAVVEGVPRLEALINRWEKTARTNDAYDADVHLRDTQDYPKNEITSCLNIF